MIQLCSPQLASQPAQAQISVATTGSSSGCLIGYTTAVEDPCIDLAYVNAMPEDFDVPSVSFYHNVIHVINKIEITF
jgi:hypothetical protein